MNLLQKERLINFVIGFLAIFLIFAFVTYKKHANTTRVTYISYSAIFSNVNGVNIQDKVHLAGTEIGHVTNISLLKDGTALMDFKITGNIKIPEDSMMFIKSDGLDGNFIGLMLGVDEYFLQEEGIIYNTTSAIGINGMLDLLIKALSYNKA